MTKRKNKKKKEGIKKPPPQSARLGTALILSLVKNGTAKEEHKPILEAIKDSVWTSLRSNYSADQKAYWTAGAILADYNLGNEGIKLPEMPKTQINAQKRTKPRKQDKLE
jgi:hypothetical protein